MSRKKKNVKQKCCKDLITRKQKNLCHPQLLLNLKFFFFSFPFSSTCSYVFRFILKIQFSSTFTEGNFIQTFLFHFLQHVKQEVRLKFTWKTFSKLSIAMGGRKNYENVSNFDSKIVTEP